MTNGEKFKEVFQISQTAKGILYEFAWLSNHDVAQFPVEWWNAEYKEPTTKNDLGVDCISREQAKSAIRDKFKDLPSRVEINTILNELPSVTPHEPRKGHWITKSHVYGVAFCSECDFELKIDNTNYCPNCGAKMESEDKE